MTPQNPLYEFVRKKNTRRLEPLNRIRQVYEATGGCFFKDSESPSDRKIIFDSDLAAQGFIHEDEIGFYFQRQSNRFALASTKVAKTRGVRRS